MDKNEITDTILQHLYGEMQPEEEDLFLAEAENTPELSDELTETRKLLTAYRLAPQAKKPAVDFTGILQEAARQQALTTPLFSEEPQELQKAPKKIESATHNQTPELKPIIDTGKVTDITNASMVISQKPDSAAQTNFPPETPENNSSTDASTSAPEIKGAEPQLTVTPAATPPSKKTLPFPIFKVAAVIAIVAGVTVFYNFPTTPEITALAEVNNNSALEKTDADNFENKAKRKLTKDLVQENTITPGEKELSLQTVTTQELLETATSKKQENQKVTSNPTDAVPTQNQSSKPEEILSMDSAVFQPSPPAEMDKKTITKQETKIHKKRSRFAHDKTSLDSEQEISIPSDIIIKTPIDVAVDINTENTQETASAVLEKLGETLPPPAKASVITTQELTEQKKAEGSTETIIADLDPTPDSMPVISAENTRPTMPDVGEMSAAGAISAARKDKTKTSVPAIDPVKIEKLAAESDNFKELTTSGIPEFSTTLIPHEAQANNKKLAKIKHATRSVTLKTEAIAPQTTKSEAPLATSKTDTAIIAAVDITPSDTDIRNYNDTQSSVQAWNNSEQNTANTAPLPSVPVVATTDSPTSLLAREISEPGKSQKTLEEISEVAEPQLSGKEKLKLFNITGLESPKELLEKGRLLNEHKAYMRALFAVAEALDKGLLGDNLREALTLKARMEFKLGQYIPMEKTINKLRSIDQLTANALETLRVTALKRQERIISPATQADNTPEVKQNNITQKADDPVIKPNTQKKRKFNPTTDPYYRD